MGPAFGRPEVNALYVQALKMLAFTEPSAALRNYYSTLALEVTTGVAVTATPVPIEP